MPKFSIEIDTDAKTCKKMVNGMEVDVDEMSLSKYTFNRSCDPCEGDQDKKVTEYYVSLSVEKDDHTIRQSYRWTEDESNEVSEIDYSEVASAEKNTKEDMEEKRYYLFDKYKKKVKASEGHKPTEAMKKAAAKGLEWRKEYKRGGTQVGVARARDISNGKSLSLDTVKRMKSYFARHEVDKQAEGFSPGEKGYPSAGKIAWLLWGGDAGKTWANKIVDQQEKKDK